MKTMIIWLVVGTGDLIYAIIEGSDFVAGFGIGLIVVSLFSMINFKTKSLGG